jgi:hypothetical protein
VCSIVFQDQTLLKSKHSHVEFKCIFWRGNQGTPLTSYDSVHIHCTVHHTMSNETSAATNTAAASDGAAPGTAQLSEKELAIVSAVKISRARGLSR